MFILQDPDRLIAAADAGVLAETLQEFRTLCRWPAGMFHATPQMLRQKLLESSRGRIAILLRNGGLTADDMASRLRLTTNAVREHLAGMERDGVVRRTGSRRGITRPSYVFELTPEVEQLLSQAYVPFLTQLIDVFVDGLPSDQVSVVLRATGERLAKDLAPRKMPRAIRARVVLASDLINEHLGAVTRIEENGSYVIRGVSCPLAALTAKHPVVCLALESLITEIVGVPAAECCERGDRPRCCFEIRRR